MVSNKMVDYLLSCSQSPACVGCSVEAKWRLVNGKKVRQEKVVMRSKVTLYTDPRLLYLTPLAVTTPYKNWRMILSEEIRR